jgi:hypothetical protein
MSGIVMRAESLSKLYKMCSMHDLLVPGKRNDGGVTAHEVLDSNE